MNESIREVITCAFGTAKDRHGRHLHDDTCFEVRLATYQGIGSDEEFVTSLFDPGATLTIGDSTDAPEILKQRKVMFLMRMCKALRDCGDVQGDRASQAQFLSRLLVEVDAYSFVSSAITLRAPDPAEHSGETKDLRQAFDKIARSLLSFRFAARKGITTDPEQLAVGIFSTLQSLNMPTAR